MMKSLRSLALLSALALTSSIGAYGQDAEGEAATPPVVEDQSYKPVVEKIEAKYKTVETIQASFTQVKKDAFGEVAQDGDLVLRRPNQMRWRFTTGTEQLFVSDGSTLWIYTKAENQVLRISDTSAANSTANTFLTSLDSLDEVFNVKLISQEAGATLELIPRQQGMYRSILLSVDEAQVLKNVKFVDQYDNVTDLTFRDVKLNAPVESSVFQFVPPDGSTVIDN